MHRIVYKAIQDLIVMNYGEKMGFCKKQSALDIGYFLSNEPYDYAITYQLAEAVAAETVSSSDLILNAFSAENSGKIFCFFILLGEDMQI